jgi:hypothetical protein
MSIKPKITKPGAVKKIIKSLIPMEPEKAEIVVDGADHLYSEIRIENTLEDNEGHKVKLKEGAHVSITIDANASETVPKTHS